MYKIFEKKDHIKLKKLGVSTLFDLALTTPTSYENNFLSKEIILNSINILDITVINSILSNQKLQLNLFCNNLNCAMSGILFHATVYHKKIFATKQKLFVKGKVQRAFGSFNIIQPKILKEINTIDLKYKSELSNKDVKLLVSKYLTLENLQQEYQKFESTHLQNILDIHFPNKEFVQYFNKSGFPQEVLKSLKMVEIYNYITILSSKKVHLKAHKQLKKSPKKFIDSLPFTLTKDQKKTIKDIQTDFKSQYASKRVVMGDVGCGKTMVMLACAYMAFPHKSIIMCPTTILANQIFEEATKYLPDLKIALVISKTKKELFDKEDLFIGTHALLFQTTPQVAVVMVDEQHRFGTKQRDMLKTLSAKDGLNPHYIQFSATPIPRTLSLIQSSLVDYSFIKELPFKKQIETKIISKAYFPELLSHIKQEIKQNHQIAIIYPLVEPSESIDYQSIEEAKGYWQKNFENVFVTHGKDKNKEEVLKNFKDTGDILLATTVVEVGISLPRLTTIVLVAPERLGLASLHQLRGRVSRTGLQSYCYLLTNNTNNKRLKEFSKTMDGFKIANLDLKFRKSGDILEGKKQSGDTFKFFDMVEDEEILKDVKMLV